MRYVAVPKTVRNTANPQATTENALSIEVVYVDEEERRVALTRTKNNETYYICAVLRHNPVYTMELKRNENAYCYFEIRDRHPHILAGKS